MKIQKWVALTTIGMLALAFTSVQADQMMNGSNTMSGSNAQANCTALSDDEQQFAGKLTPANSSMFCTGFNEMQRVTAMETAGQADSSGNIMTEDQAVTKVATDNNLMPAPAMQKNASGCPVK